MYKVEIFSDQFVYKSMAMVDEYTTTIEQDFLTYDSNTIQTPLIECEKGDLVHITDQDNNYVADGIIGDVQPSDKAQEITIRPLNALFDTEVFYTAVTDCITWLATNIDSAFMSNTDTLQNRPITLTYTASAEALPLTGFNLHETVNILSVMISAMKTYGVVVASRLDLPNKRFTVDIYQQTATKVLEASLDNVLQKSVTIGDNYGSTNKAVIRKIRVVDDVTTVLGQTEFYLHTDGTINATDGDRIVPVFWEIESLELDDDMTETEWQAAALSRAKEILTPAKYDNEIVLQYDRDDLLARPADILIGTATTIYLDGNTYASILTGKRIEGQKITLIFGVTRTELTKQLSIKQRETLTYQNTVSAINKIVEKRIAGGGGGSVEPTTTTPKMDGTAAVGSETAYARGDHVHPTDTTRLGVNDTAANSYYLQDSNTSAYKIQARYGGSGDNPSNLEWFPMYHNLDNHIIEMAPVSKYQFAKTCIRTYTATINWTLSSSGGVYAYQFNPFNLWGITAKHIINIGMAYYSSSWKYLNFYPYGDTTSGENSEQWVVISNQSSLSGTIKIYYF